MNTRTIVSALGISILISLTLLPVIQPHDYTKGIMKQKLSANTKISNTIAEEMLAAPDNQYIEVMVFCDDGFSNAYLEYLTQLAGPFKILDSWQCVPGFKASLKASQILCLAETDNVKVIREESKGELQLNYARQYSGIQDWQFPGWPPELHEPTGDMDGDWESYSKNDIVVAVIDSGIWNGHYDLDEGKVLAFIDLSDDNWPDDTTPPIVSQDCGYHGTAMASAIAGTGEGYLYWYMGAAPGAALVALKISNSSASGFVEEDAYYDAIDWIGQNKGTYGIEIASMSFGFYHYGSYETDYISQAADWLYTQHGVIPVAAAGNHGSWPYPLNHVRSPSKGKYVICVGNAKDPGNGGTSRWERYYTTCIGTTLTDGRMKPDVFAPGYEITCADVSGADDYRDVTGTSPATAFTAGMVGLLLDYDMDLKGNLNYPDTNPDVKELLMASAVEDIYGDTTPGHDPTYGAGRWDALDARDFHDEDVSSYPWNAPKVLGKYGGVYNRYNEPMYVRDPAYVSCDWYKMDVGYYGERIEIWLWCDPDLMVKVYLKDNVQRNLKIVTSSRGGSVYMSHDTHYAGYYYVKVLIQRITSTEYYVSGDYYDIKIQAS